MSNVSQLLFTLLFAIIQMFFAVGKYVKQLIAKMNNSQTTS